MRWKFLLLCSVILSFWIIGTLAMNNVQCFNVLLGCMLGSILPDIDNPKSLIGRKIPFIPKLIEHKIGQRTFTHSIWFVIIVSTLGVIVNQTLGCAICMGCILHLILNLFGGGGIALFYPVFKFRIGFGLKALKYNIEYVKMIKAKFGDCQDN